MGFKEGLKMKSEWKDITRKCRVKLMMANDNSSYISLYHCNRMLGTLKAGGTFSKHSFTRGYKIKSEKCLNGYFYFRVYKEMK